jgi:CHAD domain-containing protein
MAFRILADESMAEAVQRIAREQIDKAMDEINDQELDRHEAVHQVRKRCKKLRGLIRLVRPQFEDTYDRENAWYRDAARPLSYVRDAQSILETLDKLMEHFQDQMDRKTFASVRQQLTDRRKQVTEDKGSLDKQLDEFLERMDEGRDRVAAWQLNKKGFKAVQGGLTKTYARGRTAMTQAYRHPSTENFHEWRKRVKYHWYHMRLLRPVWSGPIKTRCDEADVLSDVLGDDHDLSVLRETLMEGDVDFGGEETIQALLGLITQRQIELRAKAKQLGARLYAEPPKRFVKRLRSYWKAWQSEVETEPQTSHAPEWVTT